MPTGMVKFFLEDKGFGFIEQDGANDVFVHAAELRQSGLTALRKRDHVAFEVRTDTRGGKPKAYNIRLISPPDEPWR